MHGSSTNSSGLMSIISLREKRPLGKRVSGRHIRDCHGDLHAEHICFADSIVIFDCIEFNDRFRYSDTAADVAFLAMDLDFRGYPAYARDFVDAYTRLSEDHDISELLPLYMCYYAYVRGKVIGFRLDDPAISAPEKKPHAPRRPNILTSRQNTPPLRKSPCS